MGEANFYYFTCLKERKKYTNFKRVTKAVDSVE